ncbi:MAG: cbb3-type cytochrome c oxidase subunit I, partial [Chloroflexi bacterium]|nr:cbb3-type cytochrome c oxidase subunit I [Chloroflexota bacterium]
MARAIEPRPGTMVGALRQLRGDAESYQGIWSWLTTVDHKRIGIMYGVSAFAFFLMGGVEALLLRMQLSSANSTVLDPDQYNRIFTMHGTTMI